MYTIIETIMTILHLETGVSPFLKFLRLALREMAPGINDLITIDLDDLQYNR